MSKARLSQSNSSGFPPSVSQCSLTFLYKSSRFSSKYIAGSEVLEGSGSNFTISGSGTSSVDSSSGSGIGGTSGNISIFGDAGRGIEAGSGSEVLDSKFEDLTSTLRRFGLGGRGGGNFFGNTGLGNSFFFFILFFFFGWEQNVYFCLGSLG